MNGILPCFITSLSDTKLAKNSFSRSLSRSLLYILDAKIYFNRNNCKILFLQSLGKSFCAGGSHLVGFADGDCRVGHLPQGEVGRLDGGHCRGFLVAAPSRENHHGRHRQRAAMAHKPQKPFGIYVQKFQIRIFAPKKLVKKKHLKYSGFCHNFLNSLKYIKFAPLQQGTTRLGHVPVSVQCGAAAVLAKLSPQNHPRRF